MSPILVGGRALGVAQNGVFDDSNTDPIPGGRLWPEAALTWNAMRAQFIAAGGDADHFRPGGGVSSARTVAQQRVLRAHQPPPAAVPGTSNHGWGIAVDIPFPKAQAWILRNGERYGWSHDEGARVGEIWHYRYVGAPKLTLLKLKRGPFAGYTKAERRWIREYDRLLGAHADPHRREALRLVMTQQRKRIWQAAQPSGAGGDGKGWTRLRGRRYASLLARTPH
ncbi:MAG TPA: M15 family metallopeptidase [Solirubrobacteraceae bacterium]